MLRMLLARGPTGIQVPGAPPKEEGGVPTGKDYNTGKDRWFVPNYSRGRVPAAQHQADAERQRQRGRKQDRVLNVIQWRENQVPAYSVDPGQNVLNRRPQDDVATLPPFADTGVDERYMAFKNYLNYGRVNPGFSTYFGQGGYG